MDRKAFRDSLNQDAPPQGLSRAAQALWHAAKGAWTTAHECAQEDDSQNGSWVHAYLHRIEGDLGNAGYWYHRAGKPVDTRPFQEEWESIVETILPEPG
jgi:hypothetical protein